MDLNDERVDWRFKSLPADGRTVAELREARLGLFDGEFGTPLLTLDSEALAHNLELMARWAREHGLAHAPHGKTPLAPQLYDRQLALGAWGITAATPTHVRMYRAFGVERIFLANELVEAAALRWIAAELDADPSFRFVCYVDSARGVELMDAALDRPLDVVVELGAHGSRTGVRTEAEADAVADAVAASRHLRLVGVAGYEGTLPGADAARTHVRRWLDGLVATAHRFDAAGRFAQADEIVVSAGGSEHFDLVAAALTEEALRLSRPVLRLLRAGAYVTHDDLHYAAITPLRELRPALRLWTQVLSRPEPGLALVNAGKRDVPYDLGLPLPLEVRDAEGKVRAAEGISFTKLSDQHGFLSVPETDPLQVGDWVCLGLSHPCTAFEKWQLIPEVDATGTVVDYIRTFF
ncbi:alanine racemase [Streptacidiphilus monticola]|uniref:Alanine racemase n=1 Tax=Streptacidiphilus monticola TaxID=2161674 RepID=A0ABW1G4W4_9ACTN